MKSNNTLTYALIGIVFGLCFPLIATPFDIWMSDLNFSWASIVQVQTEQPLLWIIDTAPVFLGLIAAYAGKKQDEMQNQNEMLDQIVKEKTKDLVSQNNTLIEEVEQRTKTEIALIKARDEAEEAKHAEERLFANMSHEIRTPLNSMLGFTRLMMDTQIDQQQGEYLKSIKYSSNHLLAIINDILELSKIKAGQIDFELPPVNVRELLGSVINTIAINASNKGLDIKLSIPDDVAQGIKADAVRMSQILLNLLNNAVKFTNQGSVELRVSTARSTGKQSTLKFEV